MATTTITMASFQDALAECADAIAALDFTTARNWLARAEIIQNGLSVDASVGNGMRNQMRISLEKSKVLIDDAEVASSRGNQSGLVRTRTNFNR